MPTHHNKLVRDKIPQVLDRKRIAYSIRRALQSEFERRLDDKIVEESFEARRAKGRRKAEELADVLEAVYARARTLGVDRRKLESIRKKKLRERGGFSRRIVLEATGV